MKGKLRYLTVSMLLLFVLLPFLEGGTIRRMILDILTSAVLFFGIYAVSYDRKKVVIALAFALPWFVSAWVELLSSTPSLILGSISTVFLILFYAFTAIAILSFVLKSAQVSQDVLYGAVSIYLLIGGIWFAIYALIETLRPGSFVIDPVYNIDGVVNWPDFLYYSFTTLTTLGYGDIITVTSLARSFAVLEAIIGVMYLAVIISRLVGLYIARSIKP
ncbi:MAG: two pore domain potassium channel family protein [Deltaproteobacteria bacterium]|nr:MAG: two pore domain potassium channel family protein [Deltaproteobacteria bacterium]